MATIGSTIQLYDNFSPVINGMVSAMNICMNSFEQMQRVSGNAVDTNSIEAFRREMSGAESSLNQMESNIRNSNTQQQQFNNTLQQGQSHADGLASKVGNIVKAYIGIQAVKKIFDTSDELVQTKARLDMINDGLQTTDQLQSMISQSAQRSRASYSDTANVVAKLGILAKNAFGSNEEAVAFAEQMNKQFKIGGASLEEQTAGMYQLTQAMASGKLQGDEFRSIMENAPLLAQAISTYTGKSMGDLKQMSSKGEITADIIKKALFSTAEETEARFAKMPKTIGESWVSIKNQALMTFQPVLLKINEIANNPNFNILITQMVTGFSAISIAVLGIINAVSDVAGFSKNNWTIIEPIILGIVAALIFYNATLLYNNILTGEGVIGKAAHAIASWAETAALIAMTFAQQGLNAALALCPISWIIIGIIMLIAIFYVAIAAMNKFGNAGLSATGLIVGAFAMFGAYVYNVFAHIWNVTAAYVEFFANVFSNPIYSIEKLFVNLATQVLDVLISMTSGFDKFATNIANAVIDGLNGAINGINWFSEKINSLLGTSLNAIGTIDHTLSITSDLEGMKAQMNASLGEMPSNYWTAPKMDMKSLGSSFDWGYSKGAGFEQSVSNMFAMPEVPAGEQPNYDDLLKNAKDTADNTGALKDKDLTISEEDLKYLRDIAEQDAINRFTTAEVKVEMTNNNTIGSELDLGGIINSLGQGLSEGLQTIAEGATYSI